MKTIKIQRKKPKISYVGSTIMQNHSEAKYPEHGILVWDVKTRRSEFVPIHNDYGYVTVDIEDGEIVNNPIIVSKPRMRVRVKNTPHSEVKKILSKIGQGRNVQEVSIQKVMGDTRTNTQSAAIVLQNVRDVGFQNKLIEDFLLDKYVLDTQHLDVIRGINNDINSKLGMSVGMKNVIWKPKTFEFSNMFSYGPNNIIDFSQMKGAYGIFAPNASGKSSLWDALSFCVFDKCSRTSKAVDVLNYSKTSFDCKFNFELDGVDYYIERTGKKSPKRGTVKVDTNFYRINEDGSTESLNGEERRDTNSIIRQYVGSYDDFILTAMSNQSNNSGFIEKSQKERKELLAQFLDMDVFEQLYQVANEEIKELSALLKDYKTQNLSEKLSNAQDSLSVSKVQLGDVQAELDGYKERKVSVSTQLEELRSKLIPVDNSIIHIDSLQQNKSKLESRIEDKLTECTNYTSALADMVSARDTLKVEFDGYDLDELKEKITQYRKYEDLVNSIESDIESLKSDIQHKQTHLDGIGSLSFDDGCTHCVANQNTPFAQQAKSLESEIKELSIVSLTRMSELEEAMDNKSKYDVTETLSKVQSLKAQIDSCNHDIDKMELQAKSCNLELSELNNGLARVESNIKKSIEQKEAVEHNAKIQTEIDRYKESLSEIEDLISKKHSELIDINGDIRIAENTIKTVNDSIDKLANMEQKYEGYEYYLQCVKRDGIPYQLISDILPKLEMEINNILQPIVDFQVLLNTDGKNINSYIAYGDEEFWPLELTSGMEKFIASVAIRTALVNVSNLPRPNFIAIDEGFGSLDSDNFNSLYLLFDYLKSQFDFIVTISHIDKTRDMVDQIIDINKIGGFSSIKYL